MIAGVRWSTTRVARLGIRFSVGCPLIIRLIIQPIRRDPSGSVWIDKASNLSSPDPTGRRLVRRGAPGYGSGGQPGVVAGAAHWGPVPVGHGCRGGGRS